MKKVRGKLIVIGGGEDKRDSMKILRTFLNEIISSKHSRVEIVTIATNLPREVERDYEDALWDLKFRNYGFIHIDDHRDTDRPEHLDRIDRADGVFFSGGDQLKLCEVLAETDFLQILKRRYETDGLVIAGTSAGAAAMSVFMIAGGSSEEALFKGEVRLTSGLGFIERVIIDTHFTQRGRFSRIMSIVGTNPTLLGLGLGENTAAVIYDNCVEVVGTGLLVIVDGSSIDYSNITLAKEGDPLTIQGLIVHLLGEGDKFDLIKRRMWTKRGERLKRAKKMAKKIDRKRSPVRSRSRNTRNNVKNGNRK